MHYDVIVIGAGIGGLSFGALAAASAAKRVLILERNRSVGGRLYSYRRDGFTLDVGAHVISRSEAGPLGSILEILGKQGDIQWEHVRPMTSYRGEIFAFPKQLAGRIPQDQHQALMALMREMVGMDDDATHSLDGVDLRSYASRRVQDPLALACLNNICVVYVCVPDHRASAGEFIRCIRDEARARRSGYPRGGCGAISDRIAEGIREIGGTILTGSAVERILVDRGRAVGVRTGANEFRAPVIVSNADGPRTLLDLLPPGTLTEAEHARIAPMTYSYSMLIVRMALSRPVTEHRLVTHIASLDPRAYEEDLLAGRPPEEVNLFIPVPSNFSPECAPEGHQLLTAGVWLPYKTPKIDRLHDAVMSTATRIFPQIPDALLWTDVSTPEDLNRAVGEDGAIIGLGQTVDQVGSRRLAVTTTVPGLYLCGAEAGGSGVGIELAIRSAQELFQHLCDGPWQAR